MEQEPVDSPPPYSPPAPPFYIRSPSAHELRPPKIFGPNPMQVTCSNCEQQVTTSVAHQFGSCTIIASVTIFILFFPCFWIPLVIDLCKDVHHMCPSCNTLLGTYKVI